MKRAVANMVSTAVASVVGALTIYVSLRYLKEPDGLLDWSVLVLSALTTGTIAFFMTWGHFQEEPEPRLCPGCGSPLVEKHQKMTAGRVALGTAVGAVAELAVPRVQECPKCHWKSTDPLPASMPPELPPQ